VKLLKDEVGMVVCAPVRPVISVVSSGERMRARFFGGDRTDARQWGAG
jgi:hypothetical protein